MEDGTATLTQFTGSIIGQTLNSILRKENEKKWLDEMKGHKVTYLGKTEQHDNLVINDGFDEVINLNVNDLVSSWQNTLDMTGGSQ